MKYRQVSMTYLGKSVSTFSQKVSLGIITNVVLTVLHPQAFMPEYIVAQRGLNNCLLGTNADGETPHYATQAEAEEVAMGELQKLWEAYG